MHRRKERERQRSKSENAQLFGKKRIGRSRQCRKYAGNKQNTHKYMVRISEIGHQ